LRGSSTHPALGEELGEEVGGLGALVAAKLGAADGFFVVTVGDPDGEVVGKSECATVGAAVGDSDGEEVGKSEWATVGDPDGEVVGKSECATVGAAVGVSDGEDVGKSE